MSRITLNDFEILKIIGSGAFAKVFLARKLTGSDSDSLFALKRIRKPINEEEKQDLPLVERLILANLEHPFLIKLFYAFQTASSFYFVLEYAEGGELFYYLSGEGLLLEECASFYIAEISLALNYLHNNGIIYRDLKPENILIDSWGHVKLCDFGLSKQYKIDEPVQRTGTFCGTFEYMAPEMFGKQPYDCNVDWWALGILLYDLLNGLPPFRNKNRTKLIEAIKEAKPQYPKHFAPNSRDFISKALKKNPASRIGSKEAKGGFSALQNHPLFKGLVWKDLYNRLVIPPFIPHSTIHSAKEDNSKAQTCLIEEECGDYEKRFFGFSYERPTALTELVAELKLDNPG